MDNVKEDLIPDLFEILNGIVDSGFAEQILSNLCDIYEYAYAGAQEITIGQAKRIQATGIKWLNDTENCNGGWSDHRQAAIKALSD